MMGLINLREQEEKPKAIIMAGGAGVGKTFVTDKFKKAAKDKGWVVLNPDQYARNPDPEQRLSLAAAASKINKEVDSLAKSEDKPNIIWDTTANNPTKVKELQDAGYDVLMIMVYAHPSVAFEQNFARASKEGEDSLPPYVVLKTWADSYNDPHIENYQKMFGDNFIIIDNTSKPGTDNSKIDAFNKTAQQGGKALEKHIEGIITSDPEYYSSTQMVSKPANLSKDQQDDFDSKAQQLGLKLEEDDREAMEKLYQKYFEKNNEAMPLRKVGRKNGMEEVYKSYMSKKVKKDAEKDRVYNDISASIKNIGKSFSSIDDATSKAMAHIGQKKINELTQFLIDSILNEEEKPKRTVAIFAGGFKPPTKGHLEVVKKGIELAKDDHGANVDEIDIVVGGGVRDGITQSQSKEIWELYARVFQDQFPIINVIAANPFDYYKDYLRKHPDDQVFVFIGSREGNEDDQADVKFRSEFVKNYSDNVVPLHVPTAAVTSGTEARKYFKENDIEKFKNTLPTGLTVGNVGEIINILNNKSTNSMRKPALKATEPLTPLNEGDPKKGKGKKPKGSGRRLYTDEDPKDTVGIKFSTRQDIVDTLNKKSFKAKSHARQSQIINLIHQRVRAAYGRAKDPAVKKRLKTGLDYITDKKEASKKKTQRLKKKKLNENATYSSKIDYKQQIKDLTKHMIKKGMNILPLPRVIFKHGDQENASQFLGKTAYYSPSDMTVVLYTEGRHPKDIARSFAHEMIHHIQNLEGRLGGINTTNTNQDDNLNDIEREAYTRGNMVFRNWTDNMDGEEVSSLNEGPQFGVLYHFTEFLLDVLDDNMLRGPISLTRSKDSFVTEWLGDQPYFILDKDKLRTKYKIRPYKDTSDDPDYEPISYYDEMEEVIDTNVTNLSKYIIKVVLPEPNEEYEDALKEKGIPYEIDKPLNEAIVGEKIECDNCGWNWNIVDGGDDLFICHKCGHDNEPENGDPFGLKAFARELMEDFNIEDIKPPTKSLEEQERVRIFNPNCGCDKT